MDPPKHDAADTLRRLAGLGVAVKVVTGNNAAVAVKVCADLGLGGGGEHGDGADRDSPAALSGADLDTLDDAALAEAITHTTVST